ncbi:TetR family transcriptional regulator [Arthrobacter sp. ISL-72]|nr:TetR family transcriptional regulator [Arthrobacter sp. ISL-72]
MPDPQESTASDGDAGRLSGRRAQAARNDQIILSAARTVFLQNPQAPVAAVATAAGVGISALYRRYPGKEQLLQKLCADGLRTFISVAERHSDAQPDPFTALKEFVRGIVDAEVHALTVKLAGTFTPTPELGELSAQAGILGEEMFNRAFEAGTLRADADANDIPMIFEQLTAIRLLDEARTVALRHRYLDVLMDGLRSNPGAEALSAPPPSSEELGERWVPRKSQQSAP